MFTKHRAHGQDKRQALLVNPSGINVCHILPGVQSRKRTANYTTKNLRDRFQPDRDGFDHVVDRDSSVVGGADRIGTECRHGIRAQLHTARDRNVSIVNFGPMCR